MNKVKWPSIQGFHHIRKAVEEYPHILKGNPSVKYRGKIKLHGTNAGIQFFEEKAIPQSRTRVINTSHDNLGFAAWTEENQAILVNGPTGYTVFGEWAGKGIAKGTAVSQIDKKIFAVFAAIKRTGEKEPEEGVDYEFIVEPEELEKLVAPIQALGNIHVLPWFEECEINWQGSDQHLLSVVDYLNDTVADVDNCDPWVKTTFGNEGVGEGVVYYPRSAEHLGRDNFSALGFKAKGKKHKMVRTKKAVVLSPEAVKSYEEFAHLVVTEARLEQALQESSEGKAQFNKIGPFIGWICKDVSKECQLELEASKLEWKKASKFVADVARKWYMAQLEKI
jgi:hypothetical protein